MNSNAENTGLPAADGAVLLAAAPDAPPVLAGGPSAASGPARVLAARGGARRLAGFWSAAIGGTVTLLFILVAIFAPLIVPQSPTTTDFAARLLPPSFFGGSSAHLLGTDSLGRDELSRLLYGTQISMLVGVGAVVGAGIVGVAVGTVAGYVGGWFDHLVERIVELFQSFPFMLLAIAVMAFIGGGVRNIIIVLILTRWVQFCRVVRAEVMTVKRREYVVAAGTMGSRTRRTIFRHIIPNVTAPVIVVATFSLAFAILGEASLSYLGVGVPPNIASWGNMLSSGRQYMYTDEWLTALPGLMLFILVLAVNIMGDGVRDMNDPKLRSIR